MLLQLIRLRTSHDNSPIALISNFSLFPIFVRERIELPAHLLRREPLSN